MGLKFLLVRYSLNLLYSRLFSSPRRPGPDGEGGVEAWDGMTPLHLACEGGLDNVLQTLVEHKVNVNSKVCHCLKREKKTILQCMIYVCKHYKHVTACQDNKGSFRGGNSPFCSCHFLK